MRKLINKNPKLYLAMLLITMISSLMFYFEEATNYLMIIQIETNKVLSRKVLLIVFTIFIVSYMIYYIKLLLNNYFHAFNRHILNHMSLEDYLSKEMSSASLEKESDDFKQFVATKVNDLNWYYFGEIFDMVFEVIFLLCGTILLAYYSIEILIVSLVIYTLLTLLSKWSGKIHQKAYDEKLNKQKQCIHHTEYYEQMAVNVTLLHQEEIMIEDLQNDIKAYTHHLFVQNTKINGLETIIDLLSYTRELSILFILLMMPSFSTANYVFILAISANLVYPFKRLGIHLKEINMTASIRKQINEFKVKEIEIGQSIASIQVKQLSKSIDDKVLFQDLNYAFIKGKHYLIEGMSGSGKSTFIKILLGLDTQTSGDVIWIDANGKETFPSQQKIMYLNQKSALLNTTVLENIILDKPFNLEHYQKIKNRVQIDLEDQYMINNHLSNLSGGQLQRILIARALYQDIQVLILDEAFSAIDHASARRLEQLFVTLDDVLLINVSHHTNELTKKMYDNHIYF